MNPLKLIILALLIYLAYRLLVGGSQKKQNGEKRQRAVKNEGPVNDVLVEDPICHTLVPRQQAIHLQHKGSVVYFCSETCCNIFIQQGERK